MIAIAPAVDADRGRVEVMGTTVGSATPGLDDVLDGVFDHLRDIDARFSTYRDDSEISRLARGELELEACSPDVRHVLAACDHLAVTTGGAFDARHHRADGRLDPSGYVKGWAVEEAAWLLDDAGATDYVINAGGDIVARGSAAPGSTVARRHPPSRPRPSASPRSSRCRTGPWPRRAPTNAASTSWIRGPGGRRCAVCAA